MSQAPQIPPAGAVRTQTWSVLLVKGSFLYGLWVLLSGKLDAFHLGTGLASVVLVLWLDHRLEVIGGDRPVRLLPWRWLFYYLWLLKEMVLSAVFVGRAILNPSRHVDPGLICFYTDQPCVAASVVLANSITLTPGTLTIDLHENTYLVHALSPGTASDLLAGGMPARVARLFGDEPLALPVPRDPAAMKPSIQDRS